ncbi:MAG: hypothetical protein QM533_11625 [Cytophagales bacterium]|nr:hypothetical protein [Cytophagales bacterium]
MNLLTIVLLFVITSVVFAIFAVIQGWLSGNSVASVYRARGRNADDIPNRNGDMPPNGKASGMLHNCGFNFELTDPFATNKNLAVKEVASVNANWFAILR